MTKQETPSLHLTDTTDTLLREIENTKMTQRDVAMTYALAMRSRHETDWGSVNRAIMARWSKSGLVRIKKMANSGRCFEPTTPDGA